MPDDRRQPSELTEETALWSKLGEYPPVDVAPYFAKRVARAAAQTPRGKSAAEWFLGSMKGRLIATTASAVILLGCYASVDQGGFTNANPPVVVASIPNPSVEIAAIDYVDYFDEIVALENPALLSDADLLELIIDDGSSALLF